MSEDQFTILVGDARARLSEIEAGSVRTCITSPPYFGLRDYGSPEQIGLERSLDDYVAQLVAVCREVRRTLTADGTLWLNLGDSYSYSGTGSRDAQLWPVQSRNDHPVARRGRSTAAPRKNLLGVPWRVAFALQADGWYLRQDIVWAKSNPMPESVSDRCTKSHEYVFLLSKSRHYYYDAAAIKEPATDPGRENGRHGRVEPEGARPPGAPPRTLARADYRDRGRNKRDVWTVATTKAFQNAHFAVMPEALVEPCVLAGSAEGDVVMDPFAGAGTTGLVALRHQRKFVGIEVNAEYAEMARGRIVDDAPLFNRGTVVARAEDEPVVGPAARDRGPGHGPQRRHIEVVGGKS